MTEHTQGDHIRQARQQRGWTQEDLAQRLEVSRKTLGTWERTGEVPPARWQRLETILTFKPLARSGGKGAMGRLQDLQQELDHMRSAMDRMAAEVNALMNLLGDGPEDSDTPQA